MKNISFIAIILILLNFSCQKDTLLRPDFVKIYLEQQNTEYNILVFDAFPTDDNGFIIFSVRGNVKSIYEYTNTIGVMKLNVKGNLQWRKSFQRLGHGFPSNVVEVDNGYDLFWNTGEAVDELNFRLNETDTLSMDERAITCTEINSSDEDYDCERAFKIGKTLDDGIYWCMNYLEDKNATTGGNDLTTFFYSSANQSSSFPDYRTGTAELFPSIGQNNPITKHHRSFWVEVYDGIYYSNVPYRGKFSLLKGFNETAWYSDANYWIADHHFTGSGNSASIAATIIPHNVSSEEGKVYFVPSISLYDRADLDFASLGGTKLELSGLDTEKKIIVHPFKDSFLLGATTSAGSTVLFVIDKNGNKIGEYYFGQGGNYQLAALHVSTNGKNLALIGTTEVNGKYQRAFYIKIPVAELL